LKDDRDIDFSVTPEAISHLATESYDPAYGARPVGRTMQQLVLSPLATAILANQVQPGHSLRIGYVPETGLQFEVDPALAATP
jgi:ATP-dependent Clp protease ATP-binding subunit ClpA